MAAWRSTIERNTPRLRRRRVLGLSDNSNATDVAPFFTDTTSANLGLAKNPAVPFYYETTRDSLGFTPNPAGFDFTDLGSGDF